MAKGTEDREAEEANAVESWMNPGASTVFINKFSPRGAGFEDSIGVKPGGRVSLTVAERKLLNSDRAYALEADFFDNGTLVPVVLAKSSTDIEESNPNHKAASDLPEMFEIRNVPQFKKQIGEINAVGLLNRLLAISDEEDSNATQGQIKALKERVRQLSANTMTAEVETVKESD